MRQVVIDIPENVYDVICGLEEDECSGYESCIKNGTLLPKNYGRLIDADELIDIPLNSNNYYYWISSATTILEPHNEDIEQQIENDVDR